MFTLLKTEGHARRGVFETVHGTIQTPFFMNVGTAAAIKGAVSTEDLNNIKCQVELSNTYHLHVRPGDKLVYKLTVLKHRGNIWVLDGKAYVDDKLVAEAELKAMIVDK